MNKNKIALVLFIVCMFLIIGFSSIKLLNFIAKRIMANSLTEARSFYYGDVPKEKRDLVGFGDQISHDAMYGFSEKQNTVKDFLDAGYDPNYCLKLYNGWQYRNPLMLFCCDFMKKTYYRIEGIPIDSDKIVFDLLINAGANINKYPYIWTQVYLRNQDDINFFKKEHTDDIKQINTFTIDYIFDSNRVLKMFLDAGADINRKGNPLPFDKKYCTKITEKEIQKMFNSPEATSPLYEAIKKGMQWESQVDLLLEYGAQLDESCKKAAQESGDTAMIEKINKLAEEKK